jgi:3-hydroxy-9,10-secoandrosta-1,3,5(10)-triene-9,17-dione monooxygenase
MNAGNPLQEIATPEPDLTPDALVARATAMRERLRDEQEATEERTYYSQETHEAFKAAGFYRVLQPKRFGGYEFELDTFYRMVIEVARGCPSTGWGLCLGAAHVLQLASYYSEETQREVFGKDGHFVAAARDVVTGGIVTPVDGGYVVDGTWHYCSGAPYSTHFIAHARLTDRAGTPVEDGTELLVLVPRSGWTMLDTWRGVLGLRGTGSHSIKIDRTFIPGNYAVSTHLYDAKLGYSTPGSRLHGNPMYAHRPLGFFHGEIASVANGIAWAALDEFERIIRTTRTVWPFAPGLRADQAEYQRVLGLALGLASASHAAILGGARQFMELCRRPFEGGQPFSHVEDLTLYNHQGHAGRMAYAAIEHLVRMSGSANAARDGQRMQRYSRDAATYRSHSEGAYLDIFATELGKVYLAQAPSGTVAPSG